MPAAAHETEGCRGAAAACSSCACRASGGEQPVLSWLQGCPEQGTSGDCSALGGGGGAGRGGPADARGGEPEPAVGARRLQHGSPTRPRCSAAPPGPHALLSPGACRPSPAGPGCVPARQLTPAQLWFYAPAGCAPMPPAAGTWDLTSQTRRSGAWWAQCQVGRACSFSKRCLSRAHWAACRGVPGRRLGPLGGPWRACTHLGARPGRPKAAPRRRRHSPPSARLYWPCQLPAPDLPPLLPGARAAADIPRLARESFPLCMASMYQVRWRHPPQRSNLLPVYVKALLLPLLRALLLIMLPVFLLRPSGRCPPSFPDACQALGGPPLVGALSRCGCSQAPGPPGCDPPLFHAALPTTLACGSAQPSSRPPALQALHESHHLKHEGRMQFGLFLKVGLGAPACPRAQPVADRTSWGGPMCLLGRIACTLWTQLPGPSLPSAQAGTRLAA